MAEDLFNAIHTVVEGLGVCLVFVINVYGCNSSKLATGVRVKLFTVCTPFCKIMLAK